MPARRLKAHGISFSNNSVEGRFTVSHFSSEKDESKIKIQSCIMRFGKGNFFCTMHTTS